MIFLRILVLVLLAGVAYCAFGYVFTRERRYLRLAWRLLVGGLIAALVFFVVLFVERLMASPSAASREPAHVAPGESEHAASTGSAHAFVVPHEPRDRLPERRRVGGPAQPIELPQRG